jgi:Uma2 family endonuclease
MATRTEATIDDLYNAPRDNGAYELVNGELVQISPTGFKPGRVSFRICLALSQYEEETDSGYAIPDNVAFLVDLPHRKSFSPDAAFTLRPPKNDMRFIEGAPIFAAEVRSEGDYGPAANRAYAAKRRDYFAAGTVVVWDVDPVHKTIASHRTERPADPIRFAIGDTADAEPALPGWRVAVHTIFKT